MIKKKQTRKTTTTKQQKHSSPAQRHTAHCCDVRSNWRLPPSAVPQQWKHCPGGRERGVRRRREETSAALSSHNTRLKNKPAPRLLLSSPQRSERDIPSCPVITRLAGEMWAGAARAQRRRREAFRASQTFKIASTGAPLRLAAVAPQQERRWRWAPAPRQRPSAGGAVGLRLTRFTPIQPKRLQIAIVRCWNVGNVAFILRKTRSCRRVAPFHGSHTAV